jgi:DNA-binding IclR family transcriptional regulator
MAERGDAASNGKQSGWNLAPHSDIVEKSQHARFGSQTLIRGLDVLEAVSSGVSNPAELVNVLGLNRSTVYRIAAALVQRRYLSFVPRYGYGLGPKALEIGYQARAQLNIPRLAREHLEKLAAETGDTVHLGILDGTRALYLDKIPGRRRVEISSRVGELQPLRSTGLGKALLLDEDDAQLREFYRSEDDGGQGYAVSESVWLQRMRDYSRQGIAFDLEESEDRIRCVAAPVRDATGKISAAISVSSAAHYMDDGRMRSLAGQVLRAAKSISRELGWEEVRNP